MKYLYEYCTKIMIVKKHQLNLGTHAVLLQGVVYHIQQQIKSTHSQKSTPHPCISFLQEEILMLLSCGTSCKQNNKIKHYKCLNPLLYLYFLGACKLLCAGQHHLADISFRANFFSIILCHFSTAAWLEGSLVLVCYWCETHSSPTEL